jgi:hypothetical protein
MRKTALALITLGLVGLIASPALALPFWTETFSYADGGLVAVGLANWATHSGSGTDIQVLTGIANGDMAQGPDDNRVYPARLATDVTYASFKVMIPTPAAGTISTNYFAHFMVNSTTFRSKVFVTPSGASFTFGVTVTQNAPLPGATGAIWPTALNYGQWYTVIIKYDAVPGISTLWVDPVSEGSASISSTDAAAAGGALTAFGLRQSNSASPAGSTLWMWRVDELSVGATFADVSGPTAVQQTTWGGVKNLYR